MTLQFKGQYIDIVRKRYFASTKKEKGQILDEICRITGYSRKHAIKVLALGHKKGKKNSGRSIHYSIKSRELLKKLWHHLGQVCSKKMVMALPLWINFYDEKGLTQKAKKELLSMSSATIDRYLKDYKKQFRRRKRTGTRRSRKFNNIIPIKNFDDFAQSPGYLQADTVAHCGDSLSGLFAWSMTVTDEYSGWTEVRSMFGKSSNSSLEAIVPALMNFPFKPISFNSDNGTEFLNQNLHQYITGKNIKFTRSRAYRKNDNCHVEQKNFTHVREVFGYDRVDFRDLVDLMNEIYSKYYCPLQNYFIPQLKLIRKERHGSKYFKRYDKAKTPYQRVIDSGVLSRHEQMKLEEKFSKLNPFELKRGLDLKLREFQYERERLIRVRKLEKDYYESLSYSGMKKVA